MKSYLRKFLNASLTLLIVVTPLMSPKVHGQSGEGAGVPKIEFEKFTLPNGLQVILHVDRKLPVVHVNQWFHVGSANERPGRSGFAHLFEHMMFQGSKNANKEYFEYVEAAGANLMEGGVNGTTNQDRTNYFATVPAGNLENLIWLEADRLATLPEALTQESLNNQIMVVRNERRQGLENQPYGRWYKLMLENLFPLGHPYHRDVIGIHEDLAASTLDDVKEFFRTYYTPNNLSLVISGDFEPAEAKRLVEKYFGTIPPGPALDRPVKTKLHLQSERLIEVSDRVPQERTFIGWHAPGFFQKDEPELRLAASILSAGLSSRLNRTLVYDKQLASAQYSFHTGQPLAGMFVAWGMARPGVSLETIERAITDEIARLAKDGPSEAELARAKTRWEYQFVSGLEALGGFGGKSDLLNQYNTFLGDPGKFEEDVSRHRAVTAESLRKAVDTYLNTDKRVLLRFRPERSSKALDVAVDRSTAPALGGDRPFTAPQGKTAKLENGLEIMVVEKPELPKVLVGLATRAGTIADPAGKEGLAAMTARMMRRGTKTKKALELDEALGDLGTNLSSNALREYSTLGTEVLTRDIDAAMGLMADVVIDPSFPIDEFEKEKQVTLDGLKQAANNPNSVASRVGAMIAFGPDHPYGRPSAGLPASIGAITREDVARFHQERWKPGSSAVVFVGDITLSDAVAATRKHFGTWSGGIAPAVSIPAKRPMPAGKVYLIDRPGAAQTVVSHILNAPERKSPDYYALSLANAVYGGGFGTRLNLNLREDKGYSYGVFAFPQHFAAAGAWIANGGVQTDKTKESVVEFMKELRNIAGDKPVTEEEFVKARSARIRGYAQQFEGYQRIGQQIADLWVAGLPMSTLQAEPDELGRLRLDRVNAAAAKYAIVSGSSLLLVGDLTKIEAGIRELNLGEVVILDVEGKIVR